MLCFSIVFWLRRLGKSAPKNERVQCGGSAAQDVAKICTTLWRESDLEVKIVKNWQRRGTLSRTASECVRTQQASSAAERRSQVFKGVWQGQLPCAEDVCQQKLSRAKKL